MPITEISIENFKGIGPRQTIPLRPITLLFGGNSAGKSTILQAIHLFKEVLRTGSSDVDKLIPGTPGLDIGGFTQYVHNHDLNNRVKIAMTVEVDDDGLPQYDQILTDDAAMKLAGVDFDISTVGVEIEMSWDRGRDRSFVSRLTTLVDGQVFSIITKNETDALTTLADISFDIPGISEAIEALFPDDDEEEQGNALTRLKEESASDDYLLWHKHPNDRLPSAEEPLPLKLRLEETPIIPKPGVGLLEIGAYRNLAPILGPEIGSFAWILTRIITGSADLIRDQLEGPNKLGGTRYIGSLRTIPERGFQGQASISPDRWANGLAAWDLLSNYRGKIHIPDPEEEFNMKTKDDDWLDIDAINALDLGCKLEVSNKVSISEAGGIRIRALRNQFVHATAQPVLEELITAILEINEHMVLNTSMSLKTKNGEALVEPCDVGVGVSQVIPVAVGVQEPNHTILMVEQPELHIHPRVQCNLGDILAKQAVKNYSKIQLLETHSEHLVLRLLRRIREYHENELPDGAPKLTPDHLSVLYVNQTDKGVVEVSQLPVTEDGDFAAEWPEGFFEERFDEYEM